MNTKTKHKLVRAALNWDTLSWSQKFRIGLVIHKTPGAKLLHLVRSLVWPARSVILDWVYLGGYALAMVIRLFKTVSGIG